ncbi:hypothetical protein IQ226_04130 [Dolichospermum sp. LEGE 00240]|uniref:hypothetical protein n=1 Tax=Dolichospermum sp. LEGE 00240 TaxID=1828603 RepID=UPI00187E6996|nr:hypothetical protein [Dolichospermum sp. LEGE 00240]MBE9248397.1 hypothetical protein [Dolichospermum sp. LEGE 00240]MDM3849785.1 hypothetical protein [Aphanizomenon gracile PMC627.10]MDM3853413.1 hypothetical protein [Aphanizomenon gracile PMC649.10]
MMLGELQAQIYWLHDAEEFTELANAAAGIYAKLGYSQEQSETAGKLIFLIKIRFFNYLRHLDKDL